MILKESTIFCSRCSNETECCFCVCAYCGSQEDCECKAGEIKENDFKSQTKQGFHNKPNSIKTFDDEKLCLEKWQIGRRNFP